MPLALLALLAGCVTPPEISLSGATALDADAPTVLYDGPDASASGKGLLLTGPWTDWVQLYPHP